MDVALRDRLHYSPESGVFTWRRGAGARAKAGAVAGTRTEQGYIRIGIDGRYYRAHRLAWLYVHGSWPVEQIDHINGDRADNRIANLREVTAAGNRQNQGVARCDSETGLLGVTARDGKYLARLRVGGKELSGGRHLTADAAYEAALHLRRTHFPLFNTRVQQPIQRGLVGADPSRSFSRGVVHGSSICPGEPRNATQSF